MLTYCVGLPGLMCPQIEEIIMRNSHVHKLLCAKLPAINNKLVAINSGGCGLFALVLHRELKRQGIANSIVLVNQGGYDKESVAYLLHCWKAKGINEAYQKMFHGVDPLYESVHGDALNGHMAVQIQGVLYDAKGHLAGTNEAISKHITTKTMEQFLRIDSCWNSTFRRMNYLNDDIIGTLEKFFSDVFKVAS